MDDKCNGCLYEKIKRFSDHTTIGEKKCKFFVSIHYFAIKILAITLQKMSEKSGILPEKIHTKRDQLTQIYDLGFFFLNNVQTKIIDLSIRNADTQSFRCNSEEDAVSLFDSILKEKTFTDIYGIRVFFPAKSVRHIYKDDLHKKHTIAEEYYKAYRGKRLSLIPITLKSSIIVSRYDEEHSKTARIYISKIKEKFISGTTEYFFVVVTHGSNKDGFNFTTAYKVDKENSIIKTIQGNVPVKN